MRNAEIKEDIAEDISVIIKKPRPTWQSVRLDFFQVEQCKNFIWEYILLIQNSLLRNLLPWIHFTVFTHPDISKSLQAWSKRRILYYYAGGRLWCHLHDASCSIIRMQKLWSEWVFHPDFKGRLGEPDKTLLRRGCLKLVNAANGIVETLRSQKF